MSERYSSCQNSETTLLALDMQEAVVVDTAAAHFSMPEVVSMPDQVNVSLSEGAYRALREQDGWIEVAGAQGYTLQNANLQLTAGMGWEHATHDQLLSRSWTIRNGLGVASLSDTYAAQQHRASEKDLHITEAIRKRLQDPEAVPTEKRQLAYEQAQVRLALPEYLHDHEDAEVAIHLAANALHAVGVQYGDARIGRVNQIIGELELPEYGVSAMYHNGFGTVEDLGMLQRHLTNIHATDEERLIALVADAYSDSVYGNGRQSNSPCSYDELRSSSLAVSHALQLGMRPETVERMRQAILGTTFSEQSGTQLGREDADSVVRAVAGIDLQVLSEPDSALRSFELAIEDGASARFSPARVLGKVAAEHGIRFVTKEEAFAFVDAYADYRPSDAQDGPTVLESVAARLKGNAGFHDPSIGYKYPNGWTLENPAIRQNHAAFLRSVSEKMLSREITMAEGYQQALLHAGKQAAIFQV